MRQRVGGIIIKDNKVLFIHRINRGREYYVFPGGGVEKGEDLISALIRELKEETGLACQIGELFLEIENSAYGQKQKEYYFLIKNFKVKLELGGEEAKQQSPQNQYYLEWHDISDLESLPNVFPSVVKEKVVQIFNNTIN